MVNVFSSLIPSLPTPYFLLFSSFLFPLSFPTHSVFKKNWGPLHSSFFLFLFYLFYVSCLYLKFLCSLYSSFCLIFSFFLLSLCVCVELWKRRTRATNKGGERQRGRATWATWGPTRRGESLALQNNNSSRGLLPLPWALDCSKGLLLLPGFSDFLIDFFIFSFVFNCFSLLFAGFF